MTEVYTPPPATLLYTPSITQENWATVRGWNMPIKTIYAEIFASVETAPTQLHDIRNLGIISTVNVKQFTIEDGMQEVPLPPSVGTVIADFANQGKPNYAEQLRDLLRPTPIDILPIQPTVTKSIFDSCRFAVRALHGAGTSFTPTGKLDTATPAGKLVGYACDSKYQHYAVTLLNGHLLSVLGAGGRLAVTHKDDMVQLYGKNALILQPKEIV